MKKESKSSHMYSNNDVYRKENVQSPHVIGPKSNLNYNRNNNQYQNQVKLKGQAIAMQEGYFPGFYPKHGPPPNIHQQPNDVMFAKHELEFHQKNMSTTHLQQQAQQQQFPPFHGAVQKYDIHEYEHHNLLKNDVNHKMSVGNNIHSARPPLDFPSPQNAQIYYGENNAQNSHNQYYPNEFEIGNDGANPAGGNGTSSNNGAGNNTGNGGASYFDPKSQAHYYDMNYHHHQHSGNDYSEMYGPNAVINENCENFSSFQQYYDHHQHPQNHPAQPQQQNMHPHPPHHYPAHHIAAAAAAQQNLTANPVATAYVHHQQNFASNAQIHGNTSLTENSNSSSDFNFLSNLNDFAPEYYQLS